MCADPPSLPGTIFYCTLTDLVTPLSKIPRDIESQIELVYLVPQTDLSVGVLTVLVKGPWLGPCSVEFAAEHFSL